MKPFTKQELAECGFFSKMFGSKPAENGWKALNNLLAEADSVCDLTEADVHDALKRWGVKFHEDNLNQRTALYRRLADVVYTEAQTKDDYGFTQLKHLAELLAIPEYQQKLADKGAKTTAYFNRCNALLRNEEQLTIDQINELFGYDYEDGFASRKQVFQAWFNQKFTDISNCERYTPEDEAALRADCEKLAVPFEFKSNINNALEKYRSLWNAEHQPLGNIQQDAFPLMEGETCHAYTNCGLCQHKVVEREDNYYQLTRKFKIDETVAFKDDKIEHPKLKEEMTVLLELGMFFLTSQRLVYIGKKSAFNIRLKDILSTEFDGVNMMTFHTRNSKQENVDVIIKFSDEAAGVVNILCQRALGNLQA